MFSSDSDNHYKGFRATFREGTTIVIYYERLSSLFFCFFIKAKLFRTSSIQLPVCLFCKTLRYLLKVETRETTSKLFRASFGHLQF